MVKNELSIKAQQSYEVSLKIAEHEVSKIKDKINEEITNYKCLVTFRPLSLQEQLYNAHKEALKENIDALFSSNSLACEATFYKNVYKLSRIGMTFIKSEKDSVFKESIHKIIAKNRATLTSYENEYRVLQNKASWYEKCKEDEIAYKLQYDKLVEKIYENNKDAVRLNEKSFQDFYQQTCINHQEKLQETKKDIEQFNELIFKAIDETNQIVFSKESKKSVLSIIKTIINQCKEKEKILIDNVYKKIDLDILKEQEKEGLDVASEREELLKEIATNDHNIIEISKQNETLLHKAKELMDSIRATKENDVIISTTSEDALKQNVLDCISRSFKGSLKDAFAMIFQSIKDYVLQKCPYFYDYYEDEEKKYEKECYEYRLTNSVNVDSKIKNDYIKANNKYLKAIANITANGDINKQIGEEHKENKVKIKQELVQSFKDIKEDRKQRKENYIKQKAYVKTASKVADSTKNAEMKEVLRLYKKEIRSKELSRYFKAILVYLNKIKKENQRNSIAKFKSENPEVLSYQKDYKLKLKEKKALHRQENKLFMHNIRKEYSSAKYHKDVTARAKENKLGYIFLSIWAIGFIVFTLYPILYSIILCFSHSEWTVTDGYPALVSFSFKNGLTFPNWTGKENLETLFLKSSTFTFQQVPTFFKNLIFYVPIVVFISFVLAMLLNTKIKGRTFFRLIYFLPVVIVSGPVLTMLNKSNSSGESSIMLTLDGSTFANILQALSPKALTFANNIFGNFIIILWMTGVPIVLFISALQKINRQLYEAAEIDGANKWQMLWAITYPLIKSVILIVCLFTIMQVSSIGISSVNPINSTIDNQMNDNSFNMGIISLEAWIQALIVLLFVLVSFLLFREREFISKDKNYEEIEEAKRKKNQRKAKIREFFHVNEISNFFAKLFAPINKVRNSIKAKKKQKEEMEGF
ncbi:MAG: ABC transporter permease subunit [Erysipelotrichaceae bacterium]|nr:ABC transporter permease subunit [Erysipelotrichaceae bacterium]